MQNEIIPEVLKRRSIRAFSDKPIPNNIIKNAIESARWAPSAFNEQPWRFIIGNKHQNPDTYNKILQSLNEWNQRWAKNAPVLILQVGKTFYDLDGRNNEYFLYDCGQATAMLVLQLTKHEVFTHQMAGFDKKIAKELLNIPEKYEPIVVIAAGFQGDIEILPEDLKEIENKKRERLGHEKIAMSEWDKPFEF